MRRVILLWWVVLAACAKPPPPPRKLEAPPPPPKVEVPAGCEENFAGEWFLTEDTSWRYRAQDDAGSLRFEVFRVFVPDAGAQGRLANFLAARRADAGLADGGTFLLPPRDAGLAEPVDAGLTPHATLLINRTPKGFVGEAKGEAMRPNGKVCALSFPVRVTSCVDGGLTLESPSSTAVGDQCEAPANPQPTALSVHRLARADGGAL